MFRNSALCTENPLQPECFSGRLSGSATMYPQARAANDPLLKRLSSPMFTSGARATEHMNGAVLFSTLNDYPVDPDFPSESLSGDGACIDCSTVDQNTFMTQCVRDSNVGAATLRLAPCSLKANRDVNQDQGSRQPERVSTRENTIFNLTDAKYSAPLVAAQAKNQTMLVHTGAPMYATSAAQDTILGNMTPAFAVQHVGRVSNKL